MRAARNASAMKRACLMIHSSVAGGRSERGVTLVSAVESGRSGLASTTGPLGVSVSGALNVAPAGGTAEDVGNRVTSHVGTGGWSLELAVEAAFTDKSEERADGAFAVGLAGDADEDRGVL
jgi:hypothetical protein